MTRLPSFTQQHRASLKKLGVVEAQIEQLRYARLSVRLVVRPPAARNDVADILDDVAAMADALLRKTAAISSQSTTAHAVAHALIEQGYWSAIPDDDGGLSSHCLEPRLKALRDAASKGKEKLSSAASRHRSADPQPVLMIAEALVFGWDKEYGRVPKCEPFPASMKPSAAENSTFREIVGICYEAEGGNEDPLAAIKAFLKMERKSRLEAMAALKAGVAAAN